MLQKLLRACMLYLFVRVYVFVRACTRMCACACVCVRVCVRVAVCAHEVKIHSKSATFNGHSNLAI